MQTLSNVKQNEYDISQALFHDPQWYGSFGDSPVFILGRYAFNHTYDMCNFEDTPYEDMDSCLAPEQYDGCSDYEVEVFEIEES